ncbi:dGTP triphosphohydrolase [Clostridium sp. E02]|uniref:dGTP triphosphohydrolase n=1 Tax=Clostridium sp. E02 TaxID=2487134 RepID=UPI0013DE4AC9|nr:dNTP triphosphohydrolase [Clostridium sp. E02]
MEEKKVESEFPYKCKTLEEIFNSSIKEYGFKHKIEESEQEKKLEETYRTKIRRQRDKILYTGGFRRLQDKTQVMSVTLTGDHRTRLTHTLEVEQIALSVSDALGLNRDLVSAIALGHDVGHTPFGHAAERALDEKLENNGGFHHPIQSAKYLWEKYGDNLVNEIYEGILEHDSDMFTIDANKAKEQLKYSVYCPKDGKPKDCSHFLSLLKKVPSTLEAQVVVWADKIAYITHDLEDFLHSPIYTSVIKAEKSNARGTENHKNTEEILCGLLSKLINKKIEKIDTFESRDLIRKITTNLIETSAQNIKGISGLTQEKVQVETNSRLEKIKENPENISDKKNFLNSLIINFENAFRENYYLLRDLLDEEYIFSSQVQRSDAKADKIISYLYDEFIHNYKLTPLEIRMKIDNEIKQMATKMLESKGVAADDIDNIISKKMKDMEKEMQETIDTFDDYKKKKSEIIARDVASYISTMSDTYAENMFCNLNASKDNYSL